MKKIILPFILLSLPFYSYSSWTPINNAKIIHGRGTTINNIIQAGNTHHQMKTRGAVKSAGRFAIATLKPNSALGLARQLAKANPYALAAMAASIYYQDEINGWFEKNDNPSGEPNYDLIGYELPELKDQVCITAKYGTIQENGCGTTELDARSSACEMVVSQIPDILDDTSTYPIRNTTGMYCKQNGATYDIWATKTTQYGPKPNGDPGDYYESDSKYTNLPYLNDLTSIESLECPPSWAPSYTVGRDLDGDSKIDKCFLPADLELIESGDKPVEIQEVADQYADDLMRYHNTSINELQNWNPDTSKPFDPQWTPYVDPTTGSVDSQYIQSYNSPSVSSTTHEYMINVSSGDYQTSNPELPNYVPVDMVQPIQTAINSTFNDQPFIDPVTLEVTNPTISTEGVATPAASGTAENPVVVTGDITVNVEIPEDDTLSQTEYEQSNRLFQQEENVAAQGQTDSLNTSLDSTLAQEQSFIDGLSNYIQNFAVPEIPTLASFFPSFNSGCVGFDLNTSVAGKVKVVTFDKHCAPWNSYVNPVLIWFFYMMTSLYVLNLAGRTLTGLKT
jgi:hypothetical protein